MLSLEQKTYEYRLNDEDLIKIGTASYKAIGRNEHVQKLVPTDGGPTIYVEHARFCDGIRTGYIEIHRNHYLDQAHQSPAAETVDKLFSLLPGGTLAAARRRAMWVAAANEEKAHREASGSEPLKMSRSDFAAMLDDIKRRVEAKLEEADALNKRKYASGDKLVPVTPSAKTLHNWYCKWVRRGFSELVDNRHRRGNRTRRITLDEAALLHKVTREYLSIQRPSREDIVRRVGREFKKENTVRRLDGRPELKPPSRQTIRRALNRLRPFECDLRRHGLDYALRKWMPHTTGLELDRPLQRVEIDEHTIDLISIMQEYGLDPLVTDEEREELGLDGKKDRWVISIAIDCATRCILALRMTRAADEACAIATVDMITRDKGEWADNVCARSSWHHHGTPEHIVTDGGPGYIGDRFEAMLTDLGVTFERAPGALPAMRGIIERLFGTLAQKLLPELSGRTFGDVVRRGDHPSGQRAALTVDDLAYALIRWAIDCYHNEIHEGIGCTPNEKWAELYAKWKCPPPPSARIRRAAFGTRMTRKVGRGGITVLGVRYQNLILQDWLRDNSKRDVEIRWYNKDIGAIEVKLGREWYTIPALFQGFNNVSAQHWIAGLRAQRLRNAATVAENEDIIIEAMDAIAAVNAAAMKRADVLDFDWTEDRVKRVEGQLMISLQVSQKAPQQQLHPAEAEDPLLSTVIQIDTGTASAAVDEDSDAPPASMPVPSAQARADIEPRRVRETQPDDDTDDDGWGGF